MSSPDGPAPQEHADDTLVLRTSLSVLEHLGLHLYSNVPAVLSEAVANAWDADATEVDIRVNRDTLTIEIADNGSGMSLDDINERFLLVGYRRRDEGRRISPVYNRRVMGRKGIGKLSLFSIADRFEVHTRKSGHDAIAFELDANDIRRHYETTQQPFNPPRLEPAMGDLTYGTRILLTDVRRKRLSHTAGQLRQRLARRFSVIGPANSFAVSVDDQEVTLADRGYLNRLQFLWQYGDDRPTPPDSIEEVVQRDGTVLIASDDGNNVTEHVSGWLGTVDRPTTLRADGESLNRVTILVRGKVAQEDVLDTIDDAGLYTKYLIGEVEADFLDDDDEDDIATSSRQALVEDDRRFIALLNFLRNELSFIEREWSRLRTAGGTSKALSIDAIKEWFDELDPAQQGSARQLFGKINRLPFDDEKARRQLFVAGVLAFENLAHRTLLEKLDETEPADIGSFVEAVGSLDDLEASLYYQIVRQRLDTIDWLERLVDQNAIERTIQEVLFEHLWLLDPAWERATDAGAQFSERTIRQAFEAFDTELNDEEKSGRVDISWKTVTGKHIIVELKRPDRRLSTEDISRQVRKYRSALTRVLRDTEGLTNPDIQVVVIVGEDLTDWAFDSGEAESRRMLSEVRTSVQKYDHVLSQAQNAYQHFITQRQEVGRIVRLMERIETEDLPIES